MDKIVGHKLKKWQLYHDNKTSNCLQFTIQINWIWLYTTFNSCLIIVSVVRLYSSQIIL